MSTKGKRPRRITPEIGEFIIANHKGVSMRKIAAMILERFGVEMSTTPLRQFYKENGISSGLDGRFKKGCPSWNKGKKWDEYLSPESQEKIKRTCFWKQHTPWNANVPVGTVVARRNGGSGLKYLFEKVAQPDRWKLHHRMVWERANGPIPEGHFVEFADGNPMNCDIDNLVLTTKAQHAVKCRRGIKSHDRESAEAANTLASLKILMTKRRRGMKNGAGKRDEGHREGDPTAGTGLRGTDKQENRKFFAVGGMFGAKNNNPKDSDIS